MAPSKYGYLIGCYMINYTDLSEPVFKSADVISVGFDVANYPPYSGIL